jgi:predicted HD phosphohydrolase
MDTGKRTAFGTLEQATAEDWRVILQEEAADRLRRTTGDRLLALLKSMQGDPPLGSPVNLYVHSLQTATRVLRAHEDDELVVVALFHDVAEALCDNHHGLMAAQMLTPWISARRSWLLTHHGQFQEFHFVNHPRANREARERYRGHPHFEETAYFCAAYDQNSFDCNYPNLDIEEFVPIVSRFFSRPRPPLAPDSALSPAE